MQIITPDQCRKARKLLNMTAFQLAEKAGLEVATVIAMETENSQIHVKVREVQAAYDVLIKAGVHFVGVNRVRLNQRR